MKGTTSPCMAAHAGENRHNGKEGTRKTELDQGGGRWSQVVSLGTTTQLMRFTVNGLLSSLVPAVRVLVNRSTGEKGQF